MKVLLDHCTPKKLGFLLTGHYVRTAKFMGWNELRNGALLAAAAAEYDAFVTTDSKIEFEQHAPTLPMPVIVLLAPNNRMPSLTPLAPEVLALLGSTLEKRIYRVVADGWNSPPAA